MKKFLILLFLFTCEISFAQTSVFNSIDSTGKKQGYWIILGRMQKNNLYADDFIAKQMKNVFFA